MSTFTRILAAIVVAAFAVGPISVAAAPNASTVVAQNASTGSFTGTAVDETGAPVTGATVELHGPQTYTATTDDKGAFSVSDVAPGLYIVTVRKAGYQTATQTDFAVFAGENEALNVSMHTQTFTSLRTIASVRSTGRGTFNTTPASVDVVTSQVFVDQAQPQVGRVLNQIPGVQNTLPTSSANGSVAGAITVPNVRGALSFETASLIDGHPLAVGDYGDYVTTFLSSFLFQQVEVVKGPGAMSPQTNYAIGGTVNFRTKDPTLTATPDYTFGIDSRGGTYYNFGFSDTLGRLGFVADIAGVNEVPGLHNYNSYFDLSQSNGTFINGKAIGFTDNLGAIPGTASKVYNQYSLVGCCYSFDGAYNGTNELLKLRYKFSDVTTATVSYLGGQTFADQNANTSEMIPSTFVPGGSYAGGSLASGASLLIPNAVYPQTAQEVNNEPIFQGEVRSSLGNDTVLARFYHASIDRLIYEGSPNPANPITENLAVSGVANGVSYGGQTIPVQFYDWYNQFEEDRLTGISFEYDHPYGDGDSVTFSADQNQAASTAGSIGVKSKTPGTVGTPSVSNPQGTDQRFTTFLLRDEYNFTPKMEGTVALYDNLYQNTFPYSCGASGSCAINGSNALFTTNNNSHFDERFALEYRPSQTVAIRASAGSAIAPPYLSLLSKVSTAPTTCGVGCVFNQNNPNLVPETAFGYDLGADIRLPHNLGTFSIDGYLTNLYNHFLAEEYTAGTCGTTAGFTCPSGNAGLPIFVSLNTNINNARFEGIELSWRRAVQEGLGWNVSGAIQHAFAYNLPANFYCQGLAAGTPCTPANYNVNLPIIAGENFTGNAANGSGSLSGFGGFSNTAIPYLQGDASINYTTKSGIFGEIGETLYGKNNGYNVPPFGIGYVTVRAPLTKTISVQVSGDNIFNAWNGNFPIVAGGLAYPLANGQLGATIGNVVGPSTWHFQLTKTLGADPAAYNGQ